MNAVSPIKPEQLPAEQNGEAANVMAMIERAATDPAFDVTKLEKLMDLQERILNRNAKAAFAADFVQMKPELPLVIRLHKNSQTNSMYAKLEDINKQIDPILARHGFGTAAKVLSQSEKMIRVAVELWHRGGHVERTELEMPPDDVGIAGKTNKTQPHAISATIMYLRRVGECALLNISTGNDKDGNGAADPITTEQAVDIDTRTRALGEKYHANFLKWLGVAAANEIKAVDFKKAIDALADAEEKKRQKAKESNA